VIENPYEAGGQIRFTEDDFLARIERVSNNGLRVAYLAAQDMDKPTSSPCG
jgi:hypothetical protein